MEKTRFKLGGVAVLTAMAVLASTSGSAAATGSVDRRGTVVSSEPVLGLEPQQVEEFLGPLGVYVPQARHGVDAYQVVYRTVDVRGRSTTASSLVALPRTGDRRLRPAVWLHGTQSYRLDAPSVSECCDRAARCARELRGVGVDVTLTDVGDVDHITSLVRSVPQVATWFATLR